MQVFVPADGENAFVMLTETCKKVFNYEQLHFRDLVASCKIFFYKRDSVWVWSPEKEAFLRRF